MPKNYTKPLITHIRPIDACFLLKITQSDLIQLSLILNIKTEQVKFNKIFNPLKKKQPFKIFSNKFLNSKSIKNYKYEYLNSTLIERKEFEKTETVFFGGNDAFKLKDIEKIYNSSEYKVLIINVNKISEKHFYSEKCRELIVKYENYDYPSIILKKHRNLDSALNVLPKYLTILFLFKKIFNNSKYKENIETSEDILLNNIFKEKKILNNTLNFFINKITENGALNKIYCANEGYFTEILIDKKCLLFLIPGELEFKKISPILFYNFFYGLNLLKVVLFKMYGEGTNVILEEEISLKRSHKEFKSVHSEMLDIIYLSIFNKEGEILQLQNKIIADEVEKINEKDKYVHPQFIFDYFNILKSKNEEKIIKIEDYFFGQNLPSQIFPFEKNLVKKEFSNISEEVKSKLSIKKQFMIEELQNEENETNYFNI